ncbi:DUF3822 family protein [Flavobacteriaceae bacterium MHTCC 0001]
MTLKKTKDLHTITHHTLSIQISLSGLSFCVLNTKTKRISSFEQIEFDKRLNPLETLGQLMHYFDVRDYLQAEFDDITVIHENDISTLVPKALFNADHLADYLKFNSKILKSDYLSYDVLKHGDTVNVYVPYVNINNYIYEAFGAFTYKHFSTILLDYVLENKKQSSADTIYVHVSKDHFEIIIVENNGLKLYNTYEYINAEDFIYYILFTIEQLNYNPETIHIELFGKVSTDSPLYKITYKYIRNINLRKQETIYGYTPVQDLETSSYIILNSFNANNFR